MATGVLFATRAALAIESGHRERHFRSAVAARDVIGQATGVLMERFGIDAGTALSLLAQVSRERDQTLAAVGRRVVKTRRDG
ncbi:MAG TPA: ANTAR domain-containing protein [Mycobacterium sp.]|nr:ANTAR domain-containing protein [Mycobacterium sp.]